MKLRLVTGSIVEQKVDAIVNAANETLLGGGGVDGAIHRAAGAKLLEECKALRSCAFGDAKITGAYDLPSKYVIHAVGPIYKKHGQLAPLLLASAYKTAMELAENHNCARIAFPAISTGAYGYPKEKAAQIAIETAREYRDTHPDSCVREVRFVCFDKETAEIYRALLAKR